MLEQPDLDKPAFKVFKAQANRIRELVCALCPNPIREEDFTSYLSKKEYTITGMCQKCQDNMFSGGDIDEE